MSESSITSSPSKSRDSIRTTKLKRRSKRLKINQSMQINSDQAKNSDYFHNILKELYHDSEDEHTETYAVEKKSRTFLKKPAILNNFKPFELEKSLAMADHIFAQQLNQNETNVFPETLGFVTCTNLNNDDDVSQCGFINNCEKNIQNDSFNITESELINCCHRVEQVIENVASKKQDCTPHELTPKKNDALILVNSILEEFSQSPLRKEQIITHTSWEYTPEFRLRKLPAKSYTRKHLKSAKSNLVKRFGEPDSRSSSEYEEDVSCSSLSVQEDDTLCENPNNQLVATNFNNTEHLCENLLSLTEYFTQNELNQSVIEDRKYGNNLCSSNNSNEMVVNLLKISDLIKEILTLQSVRSNELLDDSYNSSDDFNGFLSSENKADTHHIEHDAINKKLNSTSDLNVCDKHNTYIFKDKKENSFLADWNDDDCHDIFACINTEDVLKLRNTKKANNKTNNSDDLAPLSTNNETFIIHKATNSNPSAGNFVGFKTASSKPIEVSREAHIVAAKLLSQLPGIPGLAESTSFQKYGKKALYNDEHLFDNPADYDEWNDDCDLFLNFQTPIFVEEKTKTNTQQKLKTSTKHEQDDPNTSKFSTLGFTTAAGKNVAITSKGQATVQKLLNEFAGEIDNINYEEELKEIKLKTYAKAHNLKTAPSPLSDIKQIDKDGNLHTAEEIFLTTTDSKNVFERSCMHDLGVMKQNMQNMNTGFRTAGGKQVSISRKAKQTVENLLKEFNNDLDVETWEKDLKDLKTKILNKNKDLRLNSSASQTLNETTSCSEQQNNNEMKQNMKMNILNSNMNTGFQTAGGKQVSISAKQTVENLLKEFSSDLDFETWEKHLKDLKTVIENKNKDLRVNSASQTLNETISSPKQQNDNAMKPNFNSNMNTDFQTAGGKQVSISAKAKQTVQNLLKEFNSDLDVENCEKDIKALKTSILNKSKDLKPKENEKKLIENNLNINVNIGFQTAGGKHVSISTQAKQIVTNLLKDFNTDIDVETCENDLKDLKTKILNKNKDLRINSFASQILNENTSSPKPQNDHLTPKLTLAKRKISIDNSDLESSNKEYPEKLFKTDLQYSKSSLAEQSLKSPLSSATHSIILRKNLLSLTKKRKNKRNMLAKPIAEISEVNKEFNDLSANIETPKKSCISLQSETPNLKEFLTNASLTSTPHNNKSTSALQTFEDSDLQPINWKINALGNKSDNNFLNVTKVVDCSSANISFNSQNSTIKERIERLKMYGKAPDVSPILIETNHNCRPSGLRRTRSMQKKK